MAHRLRTVIDYDRLIVLDKGQVRQWNLIFSLTLHMNKTLCQIVEFDTPWNLIRKEDGVFRNMCLKSGSFGELEVAAKAKADTQVKMLD